MASSSPHQALSWSRPHRVVPALLAALVLPLLGAAENDRLERLEASQAELQRRLDAQAAELAALKAPLDPATNPSAEVHGYFRAMSGIASTGGDLVHFLDSRIGRLGQEDHVYGEFRIAKDFVHAKDDTHPYWRAYANLALFVPGQQDVEKEGVMWREAYVETGNWYGPGIDLWAGKRFHQRRAVDITDFFYLDTSAPGMGAMRLPVGPLHGSVAVLRKVRPADTTLGTEVQTQGDPGIIALDVRLATTDLGTELCLIGATGRGGQTRVTSGATTTEVEYGRVAAGGLSLSHTVRTTPADATLIAQYGRGLSDVMTLNGVFAPVRTSATGVDISEEQQHSWRGRMILDVAVRPAPRWELPVTAVVERSSTLMAVPGSSVERDARNAPLTRIDLVARPAWYAFDHAGFLLEVGHTRLLDARAVDATGGLVPEGDRHMTKATLALQLVPEPRGDIRPALRLFVNSAWWSRGFHPLPDAFADATHGATAGAQAEVWW